MKKWIAAFFVLVFVLVLSVASADMVSISELRQQAEAVGRWTQTYETPNGKVSVDIPIIVPEVENVPILQVSAVMGKDVAEEKGLIKSEEQGNGILYEDFDILSKLSVDVSNAATIFCANPEETNLAFYRPGLRLNLATGADPDAGGYALWRCLEQLISDGLHAHSRPRLHSGTGLHQGGLW